MTDFPHQPQRPLVRQALGSLADDWAVAIATALLALILLGVLPHVHW